MFGDGMFDMNMSASGRGSGYNRWYDRGYYGYGPYGYGYPYGGYGYGYPGYGWGGYPYGGYGYGYPGYGYGYPAAVAPVQPAAPEARTAK